MGGMEDETCFHVDTPSGAAEVFSIVPLVEFGVGTFNATFLEGSNAPTFDVRQVNTHAEEEPVVVVGTTRKGPRFRTPLKLAFLTLPDVALGNWTPVVFSHVILIEINEISAPSRIDVVWKNIVQVIW